jgi:hypothetical protein
MKRDEITLVDHNYELHSLYYSPDIIIMISVRENEMGRVCSTHE